MTGPRALPAAVPLGQPVHREPALRAFEEALRLDPAHAEARANLARARTLPQGAREGFPSLAP